MKRSRRKKVRERKREREIHQDEKNGKRRKGRDTERRERSFTARPTNKRACAQNDGEQEGKRDREKVTKVHFIEFWVAVLRSAQERTLQVNKFRSFPRESNSTSQTTFAATFIPTRRTTEISCYHEITLRLFY